jgi:hypothetical protein
MAASGLQFVNVPEGFYSAAVVPYDPEVPELDTDSAVEHLSNKYCGMNTNAFKNPNIHSDRDGLHCTVHVHEFLFA